MDIVCLWKWVETAAIEVCLIQALFGLEEEGNEKKDHPSLRILDPSLGILDLLTETGSTKEMVVWHWDTNVVPMVCPKLWLQMHHTLYILLRNLRQRSLFACDKSK
jgi:hypothetical protein